MSNTLMQDIADRMKWFAMNPMYAMKISKTDFDMLNSAFTIIEKNPYCVPDEDYDMLVRVMDKLEEKYKNV